ncbi:ABSCISIC ACID-INSENSITIVE 5-like protein 2 isoform X2 [Malania oleifera]|uniref:ABSCISIC ACID-INSENSITIVE 5-like protein 2 isoform X2 n=1 Tax=Malania oleifera TaxID=397392 RepID=UPI0025AE7914|nr:ABSCISIC ACID-INSENSITIVE 5-like protein 2 isoform X2 [Malania oleifera]
MGSQGGGGGNNGKQSQLQPLPRQNSMYNLTLDEVQTHLGNVGKPLSSMNLDELLKNVCSAEGHQSFGMDVEGTALAGQSALQHQASLSLNGSMSKKTVDEVWRDIQQGQSKNNEDIRSRERQPTLGEMTLEDFLVKAGVVAESPLESKNTGPVGVDPNVVPQFSQQGQWLQYQQPQFQHPQQNIMGVYGQPIPQPLAMVPSSVMDVPYTENQVALTSPIMGTLSEIQTPGRKRVAQEDMIEKSVERRQKRMIKNRESAARSRARKQAYTNELEIKVSRLEEENERLKKRKVLLFSAHVWNQQCHYKANLAITLKMCSIPPFH